MAPLMVGMPVRSNFGQVTNSNHEKLDNISKEMTNSNHEKLGKVLHEMTIGNHEKSDMI